MLSFEPSEWTIWIWFLHLFGLSVTVCVFFFTVWLNILERRAKAQEPGAVRAFNRAIRGFPNAVFAKMLGKRRLE